MTLNRTTPTHNIINLVTLQCSNRDVKFGYKFGQIGPKWDKSGTFKDQFQYICDHRAIWGELLGVTFWGKYYFCKLFVVVEELFQHLND